MRRLIVSAWFVALCLGVAWAAEEPVAAPAVTAEDVILTVTVPKIGAALDNIRAYIQAIEPNVPDVLTPQIAKLVHSDGLIGIQQTGTLVILVMNPKKFPAPEGETPVPFALVIPTVNNQDYFNSVELQMPRKQAEGGLEVFTQERRSFDFKKFKETPPEERGDREKFMVVSEVSNYYLPIADNQVVYGRDAAVVRGVAELVKGGKLVAAAEAAPDAVARVDADIPRLLGTFQEDINQFMQKLPMMAMPAQNPATAGVSPQMQGKILQMEMQGVLAAAQQFKSVTIEIGANKDRVRLTKTVKTLPGTVAAKFIAAQAVEKPGEYVKGLPENCIGAIGGELKQMDLLTKPFMDLMGGVMQELGKGGAEDAALTEQMMNMMKESMGLYEGVIAFGIPQSEEPGLSIVFVAQLKDPAKAKALLQKTFGPDSPMLKMYEKMGMKMLSTPGALTYKDVAIDKMQFTLENMPDEAKEMMQKMYGGLVYDMAIVGNRLVGAFGKSSDKMVQQLIDVAKGDAKSLADSGLYQIAVADLPPKRMGEGFLSLAELLNMISRMGLPMMKPMDVVPAKPLAMSIEVDKDTLKAEAFVPSAEVKSVYSTIMQSMAGAMGGAPAPNFVPAAPPAAPLEAPAEE